MSRHASKELTTVDSDVLLQTHRTFQRRAEDVLDVIKSCPNVSGEQAESIKSNLRNTVMDTLEWIGSLPAVVSVSESNHGLRPRPRRPNFGKLKAKQNHPILGVPLRNQVFSNLEPCIVPIGGHQPMKKRKHCPRQELNQMSYHSKPQFPRAKATESSSSVVMKEVSIVLDKLPSLHSDRLDAHSSAIVDGQIDGEGRRDDDFGCCINLISSDGSSEGVSPTALKQNRFSDQAEMSWGAWQSSLPSSIVTKESSSPESAITAKAEVRGDRSERIGREQQGSENTTAVCNESELSDHTYVISLKSEHRQLFCEANAEARPGYLYLSPVSSSARVVLRPAIQKNGGPLQIKTAGMLSTEARPLKNVSEVAEQAHKLQQPSKSESVDDSLSSSTLPASEPGREREDVQSAVSGSQEEHSIRQPSAGVDDQLSTRIDRDVRTTQSTGSGERPSHSSPAHSPHQVETSAQLISGGNSPSRERLRNNSENGSDVDSSAEVFESELHHEDLSVTSEQRPSTPDPVSAQSLKSSGKDDRCASVGDSEVEEEKLCAPGMRTGVASSSTEYSIAESDGQGSESASPLKNVPPCSVLLESTRVPQPSSSPILFENDSPEASKFVLPLLDQSAHGVVPHSEEVIAGDRSSSTARANHSSNSCEEFITSFEEENNSIETDSKILSGLNSPVTPSCEREKLGSAAVSPSYSSQTTPKKRRSLKLLRKRRVFPHQSFSDCDDDTPREKRVRASSSIDEDVADSALIGPDSAETLGKQRKDSSDTVCSDKNSSSATVIEADPFDSSTCPQDTRDVDDVLEEEGMEIGKLEKKVSNDDDQRPVADGGSCKVSETDLSTPPSPVAAGLPFGQQEAISGGSPFTVTVDSPNDHNCVGITPVEASPPVSPFFADVPSHNTSSVKLQNHKPPPSWYKCVSCSKTIYLVRGKYHRRRSRKHRVLEALQCQACYTFYTSDAFTYDEGKQNECLVCGEGGQVVECDRDCPYSACKACISRIESPHRYRSVLDTDTPFVCYACDTQPIEKFVQVYRSSRFYKELSSSLKTVAAVELDAEGTGKAEAEEKGSGDGDGPEGGPVDGPRDQPLATPRPSDGTGHSAGEGDAQAGSSLSRSGCKPEGSRKSSKKQSKEDGVAGEETKSLEEDSLSDSSTSLEDLDGDVDNIFGKRKEKKMKTLRKGVSAFDSCRSTTDSIAGTQDDDADNSAPNSHRVVSRESGTKVQRQRFTNTHSWMNKGGFEREEEGVSEQEDMSDNAHDDQDRGDQKSGGYGNSDNDGDCADERIKGSEVEDSKGEEMEQEEKEVTVDEQTDVVEGKTMGRKRKKNCLLEDSSDDDPLSPHVEQIDSPKRSTRRACAGSDSDGVDVKNLVSTNLTSTSDNSSVEEDNDGLEKKAAKGRKEKKKTTQFSSTSDNSSWDDDDDARSTKGKKAKRAARPFSSTSSSSSGDDDGPGGVAKRGRKAKRMRLDSATIDADDIDDLPRISKFKKKKRKGKAFNRTKYIIFESDSDLEDKGSDVVLLNDSDESDQAKENSPSKKDSFSRKNIRKIMSKDKLAQETRQARKEEQERQKRINERVQVNLEDRLILEGTEEEPIIEVSHRIVEKLKPHQKKGVEFLWNNTCESLKLLQEGPGSGAILAHCMGLGKTLQLIAIADTLLSNLDTAIKSILIIVPKNTLANWMDEFGRWAGNSDYHVFNFNNFTSSQKRQQLEMLNIWSKEGGVGIISYATYRILTAGKSKMPMRRKERLLEYLRSPGPDVVVCDEGHLLKNCKSALSLTVNQIRTKRRITLTGTPLQNNLQEYYTMISFVKPNLLGSLKEFNNRFGNPIKNGQCKDATSFDVRTMKRRAHVLNTLLKNCVQRMDYRVLTSCLPGKHEYVVKVKLTDLQEKLYTTALDATRSGGVMGVFTSFQLFLRIWNHPWALQLYQQRKDADLTDCEDDEGSDLGGFICYSSEESDEEVVRINSKPQRKSTKQGKSPTAKHIGGSSRSNSSTPSSVPTSVPPDNQEITVITLDDDDDDDDDDNQPSKVGAPVLDLTTATAATVKADPDAEKQQQSSSRPSTPAEWYEDLLPDNVEQATEFSSKMLFLKNLLKETAKLGEKILLFSQSLLTLDVIEHFLQMDDFGALTCDLEYFRLDGSTGFVQRSTMMKSFNNIRNTRVRLFLISTRAGSLGINLVAANRVVIFDACWNPSHDLQAIFRVYRFGQKKPVFVYRLIAMGTMEEKIYDRQVTKESTSLRVIDDKQIDRHFSNADLADILKYTPPDLSKVNVTERPEADPVFCSLLDGLQPGYLLSYHSHDSLLVHQQEEELTEDEKGNAMKEYEDILEGKAYYVSKASWEANNLPAGEPGPGGLVPPMPPVQQPSSSQSGLNSMYMAHHSLQSSGYPYVGGAQPGMPRNMLQMQQMQHKLSQQQQQQQHHQQQQLQQWQQQQQHGQRAQQDQYLLEWNKIVLHLNNYMEDIAEAVRDLQTAQRAQNHVRISDLKRQIRDKMQTKGDNLATIRQSITELAAKPGLQAIPLLPSLNSAYAKAHQSWIDYQKVLNYN